MLINGKNNYVYMEKKNRVIALMLLNNVLFCGRAIKNIVNGLILADSWRFSAQE